MFNQKIMIILAIVLFILIVVVMYFVFQKKTTEVIFIKKNLKVKAELAETLWEQSRGLMGRKNLDEFEGMLFVFIDEAPRSFWMKDTLIPLDLIFISRDKKITEIKHNFEPCLISDCSIYRSQNKVRYVLEVNGGFCEQHGVEVGDELRFAL